MKTIHHVVDIDAGAGPVWSALTEPDQMAGWWSTKLRTQEAAVGVRVDWTFAGDGDGRTKLRFWQEYAVELADDYYGVYNFNWGYYLESLRLLCATGTGKPFQATS